MVSIGDLQTQVAGRRLSAQQARDAQQDQAFEEIMAQPASTDRYDAMGRLISEFDVRPGEDDFEPFPQYMGEDPKKGPLRRPTPPSPFSMGGVPMGTSDFEQYQRDVEAQAGVDFEVAQVEQALGDDLAYTAERPGTVQDMSLDTPPATQEQAQAKDIGSGIGAQLATAGIVGAAQAIAPFFVGNRAREEAQATIDELGEGGAERAGEEAYREMREEGQAQLNRSEQRSRALQEDIAAAGGDTDVRRQVQIRDAASRAAQEGDAQLEAAARELQQRVTSEKIAEYRSALSYMDQSDNARMQGVFNALQGLAPIAAQLDVNRGMKVLSEDIDQLPDEYQDMFARLSFNAKNRDELARAYAYVSRRAASSGS
tara:strand:- start:57614 stop:58723 length:1110 start_codon:yes stop_codon:yes gene_type:complete